MTEKFSFTEIDDISILPEHSAEDWMQLTDFPNYFICKFGKMWNSKTQRYIGSIQKSGYTSVGLSNDKIHKSVNIHILVAQAFVPNTHNYKTVNHINHPKSKPLNNHFENLRWETSRQNCCHKLTDTILDALSINAIEVEFYKEYSFEDLWFDPADERFYFFTGLDYKQYKLQTNRKSGAYYVRVPDTDGKQRYILYSKFKLEFAEKLNPDDSITC
jgi:hypothetical protein